MIPGAYKLVTDTEQVDTGYYQSPAGVLQITATERGISKITFVNNYHKMNVPVDSLIADCMNELDRYFRGETPEFISRLEICGTEFQQRVWAELTRIPVGETISYIELARRLGDEKCIRAAASANGRNPLAIVIPCHRVIGADGSLTGYAGGVQRKQWLLDHEAKATGRFRKLF